MSWAGGDAAGRGSGGGGAGGGKSGAAEKIAPKGVKEVLLDGLVVLKIIKHCQENYPEAVSGSLLGLDVEGAVEVTHSFPYPKEDRGDGEEYELRMMTALREVNVDNNLVGWYQSTYLGSYCTKDTISHQFDFQEAIPNSVVLIYDSARTAQGQLSLKALRLSDAFCDAYRAKRTKPEDLAKLPASDIFEELPLRITNPPLLQAALADLAARDAILPTTAAAGGASTAAGGASTVTASAATTAGGAALAAGGVGGVDLDLARLDLTVAPLLERHLEIMTDAADAMLKAQWEASGAQRRLDALRRQREEWIRVRKAENEERARSGEKPLPLEDPTLPFFRDAALSGGESRDSLEVSLVAAQIGQYCGQVARIAGASFGKLYLAGSLHK